MRLGDLLADSLPPEALPPEIASLPVAGPTADSRTAAPGSVFFAVPGSKDIGASHAAEAVERGAIAVVSEGAPV